LLFFAIDEEHVAYMVRQLSEEYSNGIRYNLKERNNYILEMLN
jgi:hypothetical protein